MSGIQQLQAGAHQIDRFDIIAGRGKARDRSDGAERSRAQALGAWEEGPPQDPGRRRELASSAQTCGNADLAGLPLEGLRWSEQATQWSVPSRGGSVRVRQAIESRHSSSREKRFDSRRPVLRLNVVRLLIDVLVPVEHWRWRAPLAGIGKRDRPTTEIHPSEPGEPAEGRAPEPCGAGEGRVPEPCAAGEPRAPEPCDAGEGRAPEPSGTTESGIVEVDAFEVCGSEVEIAC